MKHQVVIVGLLLLLGACNYRISKSTQVFNSGPTFLSVKEQVFKPSCLSCHSGPNPEMGIDLSDYSKLMKLDFGVVTPGDPFNSTLYLNVQSGRMPPGGPRLTDAEIKLISDWITQGAREN